MFESWYFCSIVYNKIGFLFCIDINKPQTLKTLFHYSLIFNTNVLSLESTVSIL